MRLPNIFIASSSESLQIAERLRYSISEVANVTIWTENIFNPGYSIAESLINIADRTDLAIFVLGANDFLSTRPSKGIQVRDNILFEIGLFIGKLGSSKIIISLPENAKVNLPSDLVGLVYHKTNADQVSRLSEVIKNTLKQFSQIENPKNFSTGLSKQYYSCFISYSTQDKDFVKLLYKDLTEIGIPCWLDSMEMRIGENIESSLHRSIQEQDVMILILSKNSISSNWIKKELTVSLKLEQDERKTILFPIRIDDAIFNETLAPPLNRILDRHIGDFTSWKNNKDYKKSFSHMVRDLMTISSAESKRHI